MSETETKWMQWKIAMENSNGKQQWKTAMEQCISWHPSMGKRGLCMGSAVNAGVDFPTGIKVPTDAPFSSGELPFSRKKKINKEQGNLLDILKRNGKG